MKLKKLNFKITKFALLLSLFIIITSKLSAQEIEPTKSVDIDVKLIGPGLISSALNEFGASYSPEYKSLLYTLSDAGYTRMTIMKSDFSSNEWTVPKVALFSGIYNDADPSFRPDGTRVYFLSDRPIHNEELSKLEIWFVEKQRDGSWGDAQIVEAVAALSGKKSYPTVTKDGSLYFSLSTQGRSEVYVSALKNGTHQNPTKIGIDSNSAAISPDGNFIVFHDAGDLMIRHARNEKWGEAIKLPSLINSQFSESSPNISADGKRLLFTSNRMSYKENSKPRKSKVETFTDVENELKNNIENILRNIYQVDIEHPVFLGDFN